MRFKVLEVVVIIFGLQSDINNGIILCFDRFQGYANKTYDGRNFAISFTKQVRPFVCQNGQAAKVTIWSGSTSYGCAVESGDTRILFISIFAIGY